MDRLGWWTREMVEFYYENPKTVNASIMVIYGCGAAMAYRSLYEALGY